MRNYDASLLNSTTNLDSFINNTQNESKEMSLTKSQIRVKQLFPKKFPAFNGVPKDWTAFVSKLRATTIIS